MSCRLKRLVLAWALFFLPSAWGHSQEREGALQKHSTLELATRPLETLAHSLDPQSISQLFAFYHLYPHSTQGKQALERAWALMHKHRTHHSHLEQGWTLPPMDIQGVIACVNKQPYDSAVVLTPPQLEIIEQVADHLGNRNLKGHKVWDKRELPSLLPDEVDLARALFLHEFEKEPLKIREYEASLDLMALQILARLSLHATAKEKIQAISHFIFHEKHFRFPPHSLHAKEIDTYTFLSSVLDSRLGVCLGVSILYLAIAQRLYVPLDIITPPGHIYLCHAEGEKKQNIETTARGIHLPDRTYLGINTRLLHKRNKKEVIGLALINQASIAWQYKDYQTAIKQYEEALDYLPGEPLLKMLLGYNYLFVGREKEGKAYLQEVAGHPFDDAVSAETTPEDYLAGKVDAEGIKALFLSVDHTRASILEKQHSLQASLKRCPRFREGWLHLAVTYLQLGRGEEALGALSQYHHLDPHSPVVEYYLSIVLLNRFRYNEAWEHLHRVETITREKGHTPHCLKQLRHTLRTLCPEH